MADVKISELTLASAVGTSVVPASDAAGNSTGKVTLQSIADLAVSGGSAVGSNTTQAGGGSAVDNIVSITSADYANITPNASTIYFVQ